MSSAASGQCEPAYDAGGQNHKHVNLRIQHNIPTSRPVGFVFIFNQLVL